MVREIFQQEPRAFEEGIRDQIKIMRLISASIKPASFSDEQVRAEYERRNRKIQASFILVDPKDFSANVTVSDADVKAAYDSRKQDFLVPDSVNVAYMTVKLAEKATDDEKKKAMAQADEIKATIDKDGDINAVAKKYALAIKETGLFNAEAPDLSIGWSFELLQQVFTAKAGTVLKPAETPLGIQILKVTEKKPAYIPEFDKVKDQAKEKLVTEKATELAKAKAAELQKTLTGKPLFNDAAKALGLTPKQTPFFANGDYLPEIGISEDFETTALALTKEKPLSDVVVTAKGPAIIHFDGEEKADTKKFEEVKADFKKSLYEEAQVKSVNAVIQEIRTRASLESYLPKEKQAEPRS
ncbi:MAG: peptidyl-prolyl cis-trans isomerase [Candidatus Omnitrophica bacterium]|nr:peptidyl-prolyl cis-trans isomerase [Candidatus Omnitrophota bacterium]